MTVKVTKPAVNLREELASLRNQGGYQEQQFYFDNLVTNGDFASDVSGWTAEANTTLSIDTARLKVLSTAAAGSSAYQVITTVVGLTYFVRTTALETTSTSSNGRTHVGTSLGGTQYGLILGVGDTEQTLEFVATSTTAYIQLKQSTATSGLYMLFDNVSVFNTDGTDVIYTMPKGWKPKDVFEDGLLQREGAANDYEVIYDGFDYVIKPTVAPSVTTQTTVIGVKA